MTRSVLQVGEGVGDGQDLVQTGLVEELTWTTLGADDGERRPPPARSERSGDHHAEPQRIEVVHAGQVERDPISRARVQVLTQRRDRAQVDLADDGDDGPSLTFVGAHVEQHGVEARGSRRASVPSRPGRCAATPGGIECPETVSAVP